MYSLNTGQDRISDDHKPSNTQIHLKSDKRLNNLIVVRHASWSSVQKGSRAGLGVAVGQGRGAAGVIHNSTEVSITTVCVSLSRARKDTKANTKWAENEKGQEEKWMPLETAKQWSKT